ncbi:hypothetical protein M0802_010429 [Mischocyttarus mexicanus]|nr:hypothetical protein M0802_010429 [Mischocyttarus mexicanus]
MGQAPVSAAVIQQQPVIGQVTTTTTTITGPGGTGTIGRAPCISEIGRKGSVDSSSGMLASNLIGGLTISSGGLGPSGTLRRLHSYPSSSDTDTSPPIAKLQVSLQEQPGIPQALLPGQKPPVPERNAELLQLASARRVPPPPPPRTSSRSPLASPTSPQLPPRNHQSSSSSSSSSSCTVAQQLVVTGIGNAPIPIMTSSTSTLRRPLARGKEGGVGTIGKPPMALPSSEIIDGPPISGPVLSTSNSSSCESVNSQEGLQSKRGRQEQLEQRHQELLRKQKALQEQYARLQQLQRNAAGLATVPPAPPDLLKKTGSESNLLAKMGLGMSAASSGSLTSLSVKTATLGRDAAAAAAAAAAINSDLCNSRTRFEESSSSSLEPSLVLAVSNANSDYHANITNMVTAIDNNNILTTSTTSIGSTTSAAATNTNTNTTTTTTSKIYETDIL